MAEIADPDSTATFYAWDFGKRDHTVSVGASEGVFHISCSVCLQVGDMDRGSIIVDIGHDGELDEACGGGAGGGSGRWVGK